ncbi:hypothetical protein GQ44DRAFT_719707 [Phaeosphaeriaceae sp. PMI808]|nr:hypothetical protein GQ44DRAFT_719707 [Phaeosphaeriaceae sp. PMI808]
MTYLHLSRTRTHERSPSPLFGRDAKRSRTITLSDDEDDCHDDYPYSSNHRPVKTSRALTIRDRPSQLERYNIWSDRNKSEDCDEDKTYERNSLYRHTSRHHRHNYHDHSDDDHLKGDPEERNFRLRVATTFSRPHVTPVHHHHHETHLLPVDGFRRKEKWVDEGWETRERSRSRSRSREAGRRDSFWGDNGFWGDCEVTKDDGRESEDEKWSRYRKIKRTKTEEWRPLTGWRRV